MESSRGVGNLRTNGSLTSRGERVIADDERQVQYDICFELSPNTAVSQCQKEQKRPTMTIDLYPELVRKEDLSPDQGFGAEMDDDCTVSV
jgi:hypothetical protein